MTEREPGQLLCPSAKAEVGAILIGIVGADGVVGYVQPQIAVDAEFLDRAREGRQPEKRLRFAQRCVESGCGYWTGSSCGVIAEAVEHPAPPVAVDHLPRCSIRKTCRWFAQTGPRACGVCPYIVTDLSDDGTLVRHADVPSERLADALAITE